MLSCIAVDDDVTSLKVIEQFCSQNQDLILKRSFTCRKEAAKYLRNFPVDLLFLDVQLSNINGIEFYKSLEQKPVVIFTSSNTDFAAEAFNVNAIDYLVKPLNQSRFNWAYKKAFNINSAEKSNNPNLQQSIFIRSDYSLIKIAIADILFVETLDDYLKIHLKSNKVVITFMSMKKMMEKLPSNTFARIHRSFIVSLNDIQLIKTNELTIGNNLLPIGHSYRKKFKNQIMEVIK